MSGIAQSSTVQVTGGIIDSEDKGRIPFVSIGIKNSPYGTVADSVGNFTLRMDSEVKAQADSVIFTAVGYQPLSLPLAGLSSSGNQVTLHPAKNLLSPVNINIKSPRLKNYGRSDSRVILTPNAYKAIPKENDEKGAEQATLLKVDKDIFLRELTVRTGSFKNIEKIRFRMNVYDVKDGLPNVSLLTKDVVFDIHRDTLVRTGMPKPRIVDLKEYGIRIQGHDEIAIGIETLDIDYSHEDSVKRAFFIPSSPNPFKSSFYRLKSQAPWEKLSTSNLMVKLEAAVIKKGDIQIEEKDSVDMSSNPILAKLLGKKVLYGNNDKNGHSIDLGNGTIYYETYGKGEPLFLLHGNNESIASFVEQIEPLSKHFQVIAVDTRDHGNSTSTYEGKYTYDLFAEDMIQLMDTLGFPQANILGWSDGGNTGLLMAIHHPKRVKKLITMGANVFPGEEAIDPAVIQIFEERKKKYAGKSDPTSISQLKITNLVLQQPAISEEQLSNIHLPLLILAGEHDVIREAHTRYIQKHTPESQLLILKGADHYAPVKEPKVFNKAVLEFLKKK